MISKVSLIVATFFGAILFEVSSAGDLSSAETREPMQKSFKSMREEMEQQYRSRSVNQKIHHQGKWGRGF